MSEPLLAEVAVADEPALLSALRVGARIGRYVIRGRLGSGGMGVVYRAHDMVSGREVALKTLHERDPVALYHLKREFRSLADVSHPNLISLDELATDQGRAFFTMELVDGVDFKRWMECGPSPWEPAYFERLRGGVRQIVLGLRALHAAGKVHCDLKPSNVLVTRDNRIVVVDFGLTRDRPMVSKRASSRVWGTALYMAPEQGRTMHVGPAADWYGLGVMLYRFLTGVYPFRGGAMEILLAKNEQDPTPPHLVAEGVPEDLDALCCELLRRDPKARPGSSRILSLLGTPITGTIPLDTATSTLRSFFVGRRPELELLRDCAELAQRRQTTVLLHGGSGVGKTAIVRHFFERLRAQSPDAVILTGRCYQRDSMPYSALDSVIDSLSDHLRKADQVQLAHDIPPDATVLGRVFPVLGRVPAIAKAQREAPAVQDRQQLRARVLAALRHILSRLAQRAPVVMFIDDLQWADSDGLALLADLFYGPAAPRLLVIGTVRTEAGGELPVPLLQLGHVTGRRIEPLSATDAAALAEYLLGRVAPSMVENAGSIADEARGHPMFIDELVRFCARSRTTPRGNAPSLDDAVWQRIQGLDETGRALMTALAIAEVPLDIEVASLATGYYFDLVERVATRLTSEHLARAVPTTDGRPALELYHDRIREVLVRRIDSNARAAWHERIASGLYETGAADRSPFELVRHLTLAGKPHRAATVAVEAAWHASERLAFDTAAELYRLALDMGDHQQEEALVLHRHRAEALVHAGRGCDAAEVFQQVAEQVADEQARADYLRRAAEQLLLNGHLDRGLALLECVANECGVRVPKTRRGVLFSLASQRLQLRIRGMGWRERDASEVDERALLEQDVHHSIGAILGLVDPVRGLALVSRATLLALRLGVRDRVVRAMAVEAVGRSRAGDFGRAEALLEHAGRLAREADDVGALTWVKGMSAVVAYTAGRFGDVLRYADEALDMLALLPMDERARLSTGGVYETTVLLQCRMIALAYLGRCNELRSEFHDWLQDARRRGDRFTAANAARGLNIVWLLDDDPERARQELVADLWTPPDESFHIQHWTALRSAVQIHLYCGTAGIARAELEGELARSKRAMLMRVHALRAEQHWMLGRLALAEAEAAAHTPRVAAGRRRRALAAARGLERLGLPQSRAAALLLRGGAAFQLRDLEGALGHLLRAEAIASRSGLRIMEAAAQYRRGQIIGGTAGDELIAAVEDWARDQRIRAPHKIVRMYAPGFE